MARKRGGFALMDVMAAVVLLGLFIMPLLMARNNTVHVAEETILLRQARALAEKKMGELSLLPKTELTGGSGDFGEAYPGFRWETEVETKPLAEVLPEEEDEEEEDLDPLASALREEPEEEEEEEDPQNMVILTLRVFYPSPYLAEDEVPAGAAEPVETVEGGEETAQPGVITAVYVFLEEVEEEETPSPAPAPAPAPTEDEEARPQQEDRELVDLFGPGPTREEGEEEDDSRPAGDSVGEEEEE